MNMFAARAALLAMLGHGRISLLHGRIIGRLPLIGAAAAAADRQLDDLLERTVDAVLMAQLAAGVDIAWRQEPTSANIPIASAIYRRVVNVDALAEWFAVYRRFANIVHAHLHVVYDGVIMLYVHFDHSRPCSADEREQIYRLSDFACWCGPDDLDAAPPQPTDGLRARRRLANAGARWSPSAHGAYPRARRTQIVEMIALARTGGSAQGNAALGALRRIYVPLLGRLVAAAANLPIDHTALDERCQYSAPA